MGNQVGHPTRTIEAKVLRDPYEPDFIPPPVRKPRNIDPLYKPPAPKTEAEENHMSAVRVVNMDCVSDTLDFIKVPLFIGFGWGAVMAAVHSKPNLRELNRHIGSSVTIGLRGLARELKFLRHPVLFLGGFAALYSFSNCSIAKWRGHDGILNTALAAGLTGIGLGIYVRNPNRAFIFGTYGALAGAFSKYIYLSGSYDRPALTYYELIDIRKRSLRSDVRAEAKDGYLHRFLDPQLESLGIKVPDTWSKTHNAE